MSHYSDVRQCWPWSENTFRSILFCLTTTSTTTKILIATLQILIGSWTACIRLLVEHNLSLRLHNKHHYKNFNSSFKNFDWFLDSVASVSRWNVIFRSGSGVKLQSLAGVHSGNPAPRSSPVHSTSNAALRILELDDFLLALCDAALLASHIQMELVLAANRYLREVQPVPNSRRTTRCFQCYDFFWREFRVQSEWFISSK